MRKIKLFLALLAAVVLMGGAALLFARGGGGGRGGRDGEQGDKGDREDVGDSEGSGDEGDRGGPGEMGEEGPDGEERGGGRGGKGGRGKEDGEGEADEAERPDYDTCIEQAREMLAQQEYKSAAEEYNKALMGLSGDDRRKVYVYERLGWLAVKEKDYDGALGFYQTAIYQAEKLDMSDKTTVNAYRGAAYCQEKDGDLKGAVENYGKALKLTKSKAVKNDIKKKLALLKARLKKKAAEKDKVSIGKPPAEKNSVAPAKPPAAKDKK